MLRIPSEPSHSLDAKRDDVAVLQFRGVTKRFGSVAAIQDVTFEVQRGEIHALLGENGAGKSTLIKVLAGVLQPDEGVIELDGVPMRWSHASDAIDHGVSCVHQTPSWVPSMSITENLRLGSQRSHRRMGLIDWSAEHRAASAMLDRVGLAVDPRSRFDRLRTHERQLVALARALSTTPRVLVLDEITAALDAPEIELLHHVVGTLRDRGVAILYATHRLNEALSSCDRATVLRDSRHIATTRVSGMTSRDLAELIVGSDLGELDTGHRELTPQAERRIRLSVRALEADRGERWSMEVAPGEIVGIAGLAGSGRSRLLKQLVGALPNQNLELTLDGKSYAPTHPSEAIAAGVAYVTEDRHADGYVSSMPLWQNVSLPWVKDCTRLGFVQLGKERARAIKCVETLSVRMPSPDCSMHDLSGGNQQKALVARWLSQDARLVLLDEPTQAVDVRARRDIYASIRGLADRGAAVILASSDLEEIETLCDRALVMRDGEVLGELHHYDLTNDRLAKAVLSWESKE